MTSLLPYDGDLLPLVNFEGMDFYMEIVCWNRLPSFARPPVRSYFPRLIPSGLNGEKERKYGACICLLLFSEVLEERGLYLEALGEGGVNSIPKKFRLWSSCPHKPEFFLYIRDSAAVFFFLTLRRLNNWTFLSLFSTPSETFSGS